MATFCTAKSKSIVLNSEQITFYCVVCKWVDPIVYLGLYQSTIQIQCWTHSIQNPWLFVSTCLPFFTNLSSNRYRDKIELLENVFSSLLRNSQCCCSTGSVNPIQDILLLCVCVCLFCFSLPALLWKYLPLNSFVSHFCWMRSTQTEMSIGWTFRSEPRPKSKNSARGLIGPKIAFDPFFILRVCQFVGSRKIDPVFTPFWFLALFSKFFSLGPYFDLVF